MEVVKKLISELKSLKTFDVIWLILCTIGITLVSISTNNSILAIIASIMGVIYVILNGCRLSVAFLFGIVNTFIYGIVSYQNGLYGDFMLNIFYSCPCCIIGFVAWFKASKETTVANILSFGFKERMWFGFFIICSIMIYGTILYYLKDTQPYLDATTTVLSTSAYICLILRKKEVWYLFNISNILSILMWAINYSTSDANLAILFMYVIYTANSLLNTVKWELSNRPLLEIDILLYNGTIDITWMQDVIHNRDDIKVNVYSFKNKFFVNNKRICTKTIPKKIKTYGSAYNYIISKVRGKYFMLLDNLDYLNPVLFNQTITSEILKNDYQMIKSNYFYIEENHHKTKYYDDYKGTNIEIENKIMDRGIFPYFFGARIYQTRFIKQHKIKFIDTDIYNDIYPNILLARNLDMSKVFICDDLFYTRYRIKWESMGYHEKDLRKMIQSLIKLNISEEKILLRLVDSYNYSVNERGCYNQYFMDTIREFYDIDVFCNLVKKRNNENIYNKKECKNKKQD